MSDINIAAFAPLIIIALAFVIYCWIDISRCEVRYLPRWLWSLIVVVSVPIGGIIYLVAGREPGSSR